MTTFRATAFGLCFFIAGVAGWLAFPRPALNADDTSQQNSTESEGTAPLQTPASRRLSEEDRKLLDKIRGEIGSPLESSIFQPKNTESSPTPLFHGPEQSKPIVPAEPHEIYAHSLRQAARLLDSSAADLEDARSFDRADELRGWATKLRLEAREAGN